MAPETDRGTATPAVAEAREDAPPAFGTAQEEDEGFDKVKAKGEDGGLFQACMAAIRSAHFRSNRLRALVMVAGLVTDRTVYREVLAIFYRLTKEAETKLREIGDDRNSNDGGSSADPVCDKLLGLGCSFTEAYQEDLCFLFDGDGSWEKRVDALVASNDQASQYLDRIRCMSTGEEVAGAVFVLWGALVIGGGAAIMPRIRSAFGEEATHLFRAVTGPGRAKRRAAFVECWDSLAEPGTPEFGAIVGSCRSCMEGNNSVLSSVRRSPWWMPWLVSGGVAVLSVSVLVLQRSWAMKGRAK